MLAKGTAVDPSQSRPVSNTIWPAWSVGALDVPPMACRVFMLFTLLIIYWLIFFGIFFLAGCAADGLPGAYAFFISRFLYWLFSYWSFVTFLLARRLC